MQCIELVREQTKAAIGDRREKANGEREGEREKASGEGGREREGGICAVSTATCLSLR